MNSLAELFRTIAEDYDTNGRDWTRPGFRSIAVHRFGTWCMSIRWKLVRGPVGLLYRSMYRFCRNIYGIELPSTVRLGRRVTIEHQGGIVIHGNAVIGDGCIIRQNCTLGMRSLDRRDEAPILGRNVNVGAGAAILGRIRIGDNAEIGANAVVIDDVPAGALAIGSPAEIRNRSLAR